MSFFEHEPGMPNWLTILSCCHGEVHCAILLSVRKAVVQSASLHFIASWRFVSLTDFEAIPMEFIISHDHVCTIISGGCMHAFAPRALDKPTACQGYMRHRFSCASAGN